MDKKFQLQMKTKEKVHSMTNVKTVDHPYRMLRHFTCQSMTRKECGSQLALSLKYIARICGRTSQEHHQVAHDIYRGFLPRPTHRLTMQSSSEPVLACFGDRHLIRGQFEFMWPTHQGQPSEFVVVGIGQFGNC